MDNKKLQAFIDDAVKKKLAPEGIGAYYSDTSDEVELKSLYDSIISRDKTGEIKERYSDYKQFRSYLDSDNAPATNEQRSDIDFSQSDNSNLFGKFNASLDRTRKGVAPKQEYKPKVAESETPSMVITPQELQSTSKYYSGLNEFEPTKIGRTDKPFYLETPNNKEQETTDTAPQEIEDFSKLSVDDYNKRISEIDKKIREIDERNKGNYNLALSAAAGMRGMQRIQPKMSEADQRERNALVAQKEFMESARNLTDFDNNRGERYGFVAGLFKTPTAKNWLTFGINDMIDRLTINDIAQRWANNESVSNTEKNAVLMYKQLDDLKNQERGLWYDVGQGTRLSLLFMAELAATGGAGGLAKAGGRAALERGISYALKRGMKSLGKQALNQAIKTPLMPTFYNTYLSNRLEGAEVKGDKLKFNSSVGKDLYYAAVDDWSGRFSESFGNVVSNVRLFKPLLANKQTNKFLMKTAQLLDKARGSNTYNIINNATRYAGVNSVPMEVAEEVFDNVTQSLLKFDAEPLKELTTAKWWETTALTTLMLGGLGTAVRYGAGAAEILSDKKKIEQNLQGNINRLAAIDANDNGKNKVRDNLIDAINNGSLIGADGSIESSDIYKAYKRYRATFANDKQALDAADALIKSACVARGSDMGLNAIMQDAIGGEFTYYPSDNNDVMIAYNQDGSVRGYVIDGSKETGWVIYNPNEGKNEVVSDTEFSGIQTTTMPTSDFIAQSIVNTMPLPQGFNVGDLVVTQYGQGIVNSVNYDGSYEVITTNGEHYNLNDDEITLWQDNQPAEPATPLNTPPATPPATPQTTPTTPIEVGSLVNYNGEEYEVSGIQTDNNGNRILTLQGAEGEPINVAESEVINQQTPAQPQEPAQPQTPATPQEPQTSQEPATQQTPAEPATPQEQVGQVNYDELLDTNPVAFVEQFMPIMGADITIAMLNGKREQLVSELAEHTKVLSNPTKATPNKLVEAKTRADAITKQLAEIDNAIAMLAPADAAEQEPITPQEPTEPTQPQTPAEPTQSQEPQTPAEEETTEEETTKEVETEEETPAEEETKGETPKEETLKEETPKEGENTDEETETKEQNITNDISLQRQFVESIKNEMLQAIDTGEKPFKSIADLRKRANDAGLNIDKEGRDDILLQELVEDALVRAGRIIIERNGRRSRKSFDLIKALYDMQPTINSRSSNRIKLQQYSTPLPMAWVANYFALSKNGFGRVLEPTAGNGMLVFTVPFNQAHVNEIDETRLSNLREQGFTEITNQDANNPFEGGKQYDAIIANPPFGQSEAINYDGKNISGLEQQIALNALASMKDDGMAVIIIGGNMEYAENGAIKNKKQFFTYLYDNYNVKGVIDMSGDLYKKQGTSYPTRMILIDGRRSEQEKSEMVVYPPVQSKALRKAESFDDLYDIVNELLTNNEKTNGTVLRRGEQRLSSDRNNNSRTSNRGTDNRESDEDDTTRRLREGDRADAGRRVQDGSEPVLRQPRQDESVSTTEGQSNTAGVAGGRTESGDLVDGVGQLVDVALRGSVTGGVKQDTKRELTEAKLPYRPHNTSLSLNSVAPAAMVEAMDKALSVIEQEYGSIDGFVMSQLGYNTIDELHNALAAEQIDSVAMAIYQMLQGQSLIIGDQTGVGKGRQMAALIRWAVRKGKKPIFFTQKADLFSDIYRDLVDIGSSELVPFIFNSSDSKENKGEMVDANGNVVYRGLSNAKMREVISTGVLPEYDYCVITYSQISSGDAQSQEEMREMLRVAGQRASRRGEQTSQKAALVRQMARNNILLLDESHSAAGLSKTGAFLQSIVRDAEAVTFSSATFAKRPDTMPLYALRTAMSQANISTNELINIIARGGVTLQEIMSRELTNAGQMVRRERDMSDVVTDWKIIDNPKIVKKAKESYDRTIAAFNKIIEFQEKYIKPFIQAQANELAVRAANASTTRGTERLGIGNTPFASKTYNYTKQLMLALKVDAIVEEVENQIKNGNHPVIALESTMESLLDGYNFDDVVQDNTFAASLLRGLNSIRQYTITTSDNSYQSVVEPSQLGKEGEQAYNQLVQFIRDSTSDLYISPIDAIIQGLTAKGYKVGELTGRKSYLSKQSDGTDVVKRRADKDKKRMARDFNNGSLDVLILNKSASTGISLHASSRFADQRQRTMIIAQPLSDINDYMQMIGRIDRTGQVHRGYYINLGLPIPAENRFLMMLSTKLKSLNANTTTSQDNEGSNVEAPDLLNKYGSQVVVEYLRDNPDIYEKIGSPLKRDTRNVSAAELDEYQPQADDARKITGYVALLNTSEQEEFYNDVIKRYNDLIQYLNDTNSNDLKISVLPLRAKTLDRQVASEGVMPDGNNPFAKNSFVERVEMDVLRKPFKSAEIKKSIEQINGSLSSDEHLQKIRDTIDNEVNSKTNKEEERYQRDLRKAEAEINKYTDRINKQDRTEEEKNEQIENFVNSTNTAVEEQHNNNLSRINASSNLLSYALRLFKVGKTYLVPDNLEDEVYHSLSPAIFLGYKTKESKITPSTSFAVFATLDSRKKIEIKFSDLFKLNRITRATNDNYERARTINLDNWDEQIPSQRRAEGFIMTGNILQAISDTLDEHGSYQGKLITYTDVDGNIHDGVLMPDNWDTQQLRSNGVPILSRLEQIRNGERVESTDGNVVIERGNNYYYLTVPTSRKSGGQYFLNDSILSLVRNGVFYPNRGSLRADIDTNNITEVVSILSDMGVRVPTENNIRFRGVDNDSSSVVRFRSVEPGSEKYSKLRKELTTNGEYVTMYANAVKIGGNYYPAMNTKTEQSESRGKATFSLGEPIVAGSIIESEANYANIKRDENGNPIVKTDKNGNEWYEFILRGADGSTTPVAFNPYIHLTEVPLNDQFKKAWDKPLVVLEMRVPISELNSNYKAKGAKNSVGVVEWKGGSVMQQMKQKRMVALTRYAMPIGEVSVDDVADKIMSFINNDENKDIKIPINTVTPELRDALAERGAVFAPSDYNAGEAGNKVLDKAYKEWKAKREEYKGKARLRATDAQMQLSDSNIGDKIEQVRSVADALSEKYGVKVNVIESVDSITDSDGYLQRAKRGSKGWFDASTGEVFIVAPNADSIDDVKQTYLHEVVGHLGLAKLLGNQFKPVMDSIFRSMSLDEQIDYLRRFSDKTIAAEEYCAEMAENIDNANPTMLVKIKEIILAGLRKIGINVPMSVDSVMYLLWKSKRRLEKNATIRQQYDYIQTDNKLRFRMGLSNDYAMSGFDKFAQSIYDSLKPINMLTDIIKQRGGDLSNNPVTKELLRSSKSKNEFDKFTEGFFKPILSAMAEIQRAAGNAFKTQDDVIQFINHTLIALHAAERNKYVACSNIANYAYPYLSRAFINSVGGREAAKALVMQLAEKMYDNQMRGIVNQLGNGSVYDESLYTSEQCTEIDNIIVKMRDAKIGNDDITLSVMDDTNNNLSGYSDTEARDVLKESYEKVSKTQWQDLSAAIKRATDEIINIYFRHNILDAQAASRIKSMYKNYVPLREWEETDGTEYASFGRGGTATPAYIRRAEGRKSLAEEPIAEIGKMAMSAIMMGGKNDVMVSAFRLAENNISNEDLFEIPVVYEVTDDETGEIELWLERPPQALFDAGRVKTTRSKGNYNWHKTSKQQEAHAIKAVIKGVQHIAYYQGTIGVESVAALKGLNNANINNQLLQYASSFTRWINANRTSRNPVFLVKNMIRDMMFAFFTYSAKGHNPLRLASNLPKAFTDIWRESMGGNPSSDYVNFLNNGGRTGYLDIRKGDINEIKKDYKKMVNAMRKGKLTDSRAYKAFASVYNLFNNLSETTMRYATYLSEVQRGETMENAALAAKEATVNFNRRGDWSPALGIWFEFYNAALQGSMNFLNLAFNKDWKITARSWAMIAAVAGIDVLLRMLDDDDKEEDNEEKLNDYIRYSNICIPLGKGESGKRQYLLIPKAQGVRAMSNLGNIVYDFMQGDKTIKESVVQYLNGLESDLMPISVEPVNTFNSDKTKQQLLKDIVPAAVRPLVEVMVNVDYKGDRIYRDDNAFGDITPEYKKTIGATNKYIVGTSKYLNNIFGTDELSGKWQIGKDGKATKFDVGEMLDINPSGVQHLINGYLAGVYALANKAVAFVQSDDKNLNYAPFVGDFLKSSYEESGFGLYNELKNNLRIGKMTINAINPLEDMDTYKRVRIYYDGLDRLVSPYVDIVERYNKAIENTTDEGQKAYLKQEREKALKTLKKQYDKLYEIISNINK